MLLLAFVFSGFSAQARPLDQGQIMGQPIFYQHTIPPEVSLLAPPEAQSLFWGTFTPEGTKTSMALHLMRLKPQHSKSHLSSQALCCSLTLFKRKGKTWRPILETPLSYRLPDSAEESGNLSFTARFYWINVRKQKIPLLRVHAIEKDNGYGPYGPYGNGEALFASFSKGWNSLPGIQLFRFGEWFSSDSIGQSNRVEADENGMARIVSQIFPASDSPPAQLYFPWDVKRGRFWPDAPTQEQFKPPNAPLNWNFSL
ncbi:hypothetical protein IAD21_02368 [Abditibacteriota bacterium]|nr:hypothetical protein IAD21_02368 [Abditibacteriota bacterium]